MKKFFAFLMVLTVLMSAFAVTAAAEGGKDKPLDIVSSTLDSGCIAPGEEIKLVFSKNIAYQDVREDNMGLFTLEDAEGNEIESEVIIADLQVEPEKKNDVIIKPAAELPEGEYILTAHAGITAKNGTSTEEDIVMNFTVSAATPAEEPAETPAEEPAEAPAEEPAETPAEDPAEAPAEESAEAPAEEKNSAAVPVIIAVAAVAAVIIIVAVVNKNKKK